MRLASLGAALCRLAFLMSVATPVAFTYPLSSIGPEAKKLWLSMCVYAAERSGAAVVKIFQWASSRPDLFGNEFYSTFRKLQDETTPHQFKHTEKLLEEAFGPDWKGLIELTEDSPILGSGCIGQVYKAHMNSTPVALKILHPNVQNGIEADLDILYTIAKMMNISERIRYLNLPGMVDEFSGLLSDQLDLNNEAKNLLLFRDNFDNDEDIYFPKLHLASKNAMVMEFIDALSLRDFVEKHKHNKQLLDAMCDKGIRAICRMIFDHNLVHGDIHPGNILFKDDRMILLDCGIAKKFTRADHKLLTDVLAGFITGDGASAGKALIRDSENKTSIKPVNEDAFVDVLNEMCEQAKRDRSFFDKIGNYVKKICDAASENKIMMNQGFVSIALTVRVMEGVAFALNPEAKIIRISNGIIMKVRAEEMLGVVNDKRFSREDLSVGYKAVSRRFPGGLPDK